MIQEPPSHFNFARDVMERWARERPDAMALWWVDESGGQEQKFSFGQLAERFSSRRHFLPPGHPRGDRVLVSLPRVPQWWIAMLGLMRLGAVPIPGTPLLTTERHPLSRRSRRASAPSSPTPTAREGRRVLPANPHSGRRRAGRPGWIDFDAGLARRARSDVRSRDRRASDEPGIIYFTSGTTGPPKMVLHTQASYGLGHRITGELWLDLKPDDVHWNLSDTGWAKAAWSSFYGPWHMGACVFALDSRGKFDRGGRAADAGAVSDHDLVRPADGAAADGARGSVRVAIPEAAPLRQRGRAAESRGHRDLEDRRPA